MAGPLKKTKKKTFFLRLSFKGLVELKLYNININNLAFVPNCSLLILNQLDYLSKINEITDFLLRRLRIGYAMILATDSPDEPRLQCFYLLNKFII